MPTFEILVLIKATYCYTNISIAYRIHLTLSLTDTFAEKKISKLNLLKNYLSSLILEKRFNGLVILCIEKYIIEHIDVDTVICSFPFRNALRNYFE
jgi:hypothetical protein